MPAPSHTTGSIARHVGGTLEGPDDLAITGLAELGRGKPGDLTFIGAARFLPRWDASQASAALIEHDVNADPPPGKALIRVDNADLAMAAALELFAPTPARPEPGVHPAAIIDPAAHLGDDVIIGPHCVIEADAHIGDGAWLGPNVSIGRAVRLGTGCRLHAGVTVYPRCSIGEQTIIHANAVIGADGFGYRPGRTDAGQPPIVKIPHLGAVSIGRFVEIGAGTCIDQGKFEDTAIGDFCKIDNLVQIGHNCRLGRAVLIAGCTAIAGSVDIGDGTQVGGGARFKDHVTVGSRVQIAGNAAVIDDIPDGQAWAGIPAKPIKLAIREELALRQLPDVLKQVRRQQKQQGS